MPSHLIKLEEPFEVNLSKNPIALKLGLAFGLESYIDNFGVASSQHLEFTSDPANGDTLQFDWDNKTVIFDVVVTPEIGAGDEIQAGTVTPGYLAIVADQINRNLLLKNDFIIEYDAGFPDSIKFTAREVGAKFDLSATSSTFTSVMNVIAAGVDRQGLINFNHTVAMRVNVEEVYQSGEYKRLPAVHLKANPYTVGVPITVPIVAELRGDVLHDLAELLHPYVDEIPDKPDVAESIFVKCININKRFFFEYYELDTSEGNGLEANRVYESDVVRVHKGGVRFEHYQAVRDFMEDYVIDKEAFLTTRPKTREVTASQQEHLYFIQHLPPPLTGSFFLKQKVFYSDGTDTTVDVLSFPENQWLRGETGRFPAGFEQNGLDLLNPSKTPLYYETWITKDATVISETITYELIPETYLDTQLHYEGSVGQWETLLLTGRKENGVEVNKDEFDRLLKFDYDTEDESIVSLARGYREFIKASTGMKSEEEIRALIDLVKSEHVYLLENGKHIPVTIPKASYSLKKDDNHKYFLNLELLPAVKQDNFSDIVT